MVDKELLTLLVCSRCRQQLKPVESSRALFCEACRLRYPVRDGIPLMKIAEAEDLSQSIRSGDRHPAFAFRITDGPDAGMSFSLERGTCKALCRADGDMEKTSVFHVDINLALDEGAKSLIMKYIGKQFAGREDAKRRLEGEAERLGLFHRSSDQLLHDRSLSKLHAMLFSDPQAKVGILDLVSKNGTFVNGEEVESRILNRGDVIEVGETKIAFEG